MKQASNAFGASDGWVLYTSEDGHKYHWNHLTHESRWAKRADDRHAEESFQAHTRQCISTTDPDKHCADRPHDRLDNVEVGGGEDDDVVNDELGGFVIPSAGVGPIAMPVTDSDRACSSGIAGRVSDALRKTIKSVERPRQNTAGERSGNEQDPELGQKKRSKGRTSHCHHRHKDKGLISSNDNSSGSESGDDGGSDCAGRSSSGGGTTNNHFHACGGVDRGATRWQPGRDHVDTAGGSGSSNSRPSTTGNDFYEGAHGSHNLRRSGDRRKGKASTKEPKSVCRHRAVTPMTAELFKGLGRQAVENAVRVTVRAVLGGWKGMTTAALRAVRKWQINGNFGGAVLPIAIIPSTSSKESHSKTTHCQRQDDDIKTDSAQVQPFLPNASGPPQQFRSSNRFGIGAVQQVPERTDITEGFREEEGEAGRWVGGDGGVEE